MCRLEQILPGFPGVADEGLDYISMHPGKAMGKRLRGSPEAFILASGSDTTQRASSSWQGIVVSEQGIGRDCS